MEFSEYLRLYGGLSITRWRELGISGMDNAKYRRSLHSGESISDVKEAGRWWLFNWYMSNASINGTSDYNADNAHYDRVVFDFDNESNPGKAIEVALRFAETITDKYGAVSLVTRSGFKGAGVYLFYNRPVDWHTQRQLFEFLALYALDPRLIDYNMNQWNRLARVPLTYNLKHNERRLAEIIYPEVVSDYRSFSWSLIKPLNVDKVVIPQVKLPELPKPRIIRAAARTGANAPRRFEWVEELIRNGAPDGRRRLIGLVIMPYLANYLKLTDEEVLELCRQFIEASCRNHGNCGKIYESWLRSQLRLVRERGYRVISLRKLKEKYPDLASIVDGIVQNSKKA